MGGQVGAIGTLIGIWFRDVLRAGCLPTGVTGLAAVAVPPIGVGNATDQLIDVI